MLRALTAALLLAATPLAAADTAFVPVTDATLQNPSPNDWLGSAGHTTTSASAR